jgi:hypothetical protein
MSAQEISPRKRVVSFRLDEEKWFRLKVALLRNDVSAQQSFERYVDRYLETFEKSDV